MALVVQEDKAVVGRVIASDSDGDEVMYSLDMTGRGAAAGRWTLGIPIEAAVGPCSARYVLGPCSWDVFLGWKCSGARTGKSHCYWEVLAETSSVTIVRP